MTDTSDLAPPEAHSVGDHAISNPAAAVPLADRVVTAYHGTSAAAAAEICATNRILYSRNSWDWLGWGSYFWEDGPHRAWEWATAQFGDQAAVVSVPVRLGKCLNLCDGSQHPVVRMGYERIRSEYERLGRELPTNKADLRRPLDCLVLNFVCTELLRGVDTVRASFQEGKDVYPGSAFTANSHVHLCVRRESAFAGPFEAEVWS